jgi:hypothetical protein
MAGDTNVSINSECEAMNNRIRYAYPLCGVGRETYFRQLPQVGCGTNQSTNPSNLFDDIDTIDKIWFNMAALYLRNR